MIISTIDNIYIIGVFFPQKKQVPSSLWPASTAKDDIYIDDEALEGSGNGEIKDDLESSGSGFGPDDEDGEGGSGGLGKFIQIRNS